MLRVRGTPAVVNFGCTDETVYTIKEKKKQTNLKWYRLAFLLCVV